MLLEVNLGFLCSVLAVLLGWLAGRWKWRRVSARREEIRRLMILASEETERAELEAASPYLSYGSPLDALPVAEEPVIGVASSPVRGRPSEHKCEVCFSPTTTRCKQCKAVRYCSTKCQVFHWRQGHKDECHSLATHQDVDPGGHSRLKDFKKDDATHQDVDRGGHSRLKDFKKDEIESSQNVIQFMHNTKPVESFESSPDKPVFSNPIPRELGESNAPDSVTKGNRKQTNLNVKSSVHESSSPTISTNKPAASDNNFKAGLNKMKSTRPISSEKPSFANPEYTPAANIVTNKPKSGCIDIDDESLSEEHFEPSSFWAGKIEPKKSNFDALEFDDVKTSKSRSSFLQSSCRASVHVEMLGSDVKRVQIQTDDLCPDTSMPRKSIVLPKVSKDALKAKEPILTCKLPSQNGISSKEEAKLSSIACPEQKSENGHNMPSKHVDNVSSLQSLPPKVVDQQVDGTNGLSDTLKSQRQDSSKLKSSEAHLTSSVSAKKTTTTFLYAQSVENKYNHDEFATSRTNPTARSVFSELGPSNFNRHSTVGAGSGIMGRYEGLFPYELFVKLYNWNKVELRPSGLKNCGNSCYANAVLQCLAFTPPLTAYFLQGLHAKTCHKKEWCLICEFEVLVKKAQEGNYSLSPARLMSQMQNVASHLGNGREEDAHEFLSYAIEAMQLVCLKNAGIKTPGSSDEDTTLLGLTFGGYLQSKIQCMKCGGKSRQRERIMDLTIEIGGEIGSLEDALRQFTRSEILDGENKYLCGSCKSYEKAKKKLRVLEAPNVLTIALKRYQSGEFGKLNKSVKFPEILNLASYMRGTSDKSPIYQLYGAVVHLDVKNATFTGHYVCYVKNNQGKWFKADDSSVQAVELGKVLSNDAYMLFYARCSPRAPRQIRSSIAVDPRKSKNPSSKLKFHPTEPWDFSLSELNRHNTRLNRSNSEEEYLTEHSSFFSENGSHSTSSSSRGSTSTDDNIFDHPDCWNLTPSESETPSPSSSLSSPPRTRHSPLADLDRYSSDANGDGFWARSEEFRCRDNNNNNNNADRLGNSRRSMMR